MLTPGAKIGILGGGQLGRMLAMAAAQLGFAPAIYAPEENPPAAQVATHWRGGYEDETRLAKFCQAMDCITYEFENIPPAVGEVIAASGGQVFPPVAALATTRDRLVEKNFIRDLGLDPAPFIELAKGEAILPALEQLGGAPAILKTSQGGYDGKGQQVIASEAQAQAAREKITGRAVLERFIEFEAEAARVAAFGDSGQMAAYDLTRTFHEGGILRRTEVGGSFSKAIEEQTLATTKKIAQALDYRGVLAVEFFIGAGDKIWVNEIAPRVHNAGHWTLDACQASQFEQHIRAIAGWPLASPKRHSDARMENLIGDEIENWPTIVKSGAALHLYGKAKARAGRKMGHITRLYRLGELPAS